MTSVNRKTALTDLAGKSWADLCESSQSSQSQLEAKNEQTNAKQEDSDLYDLIFEPIKKESDKVAPQDDLSLTSFMNNVHMVTPIKQEDVKSSLSTIIDEETICSPFVKEEIDVKLTEKIDKKTEVSSQLNGIQHAKRRLTSECGSLASETESVTTERVKKVNKQSIDQKDIHDVESPK